MKEPRETVVVCNPEYLDLLSLIVTAAIHDIPGHDLFRELSINMELPKLDEPFDSDKLALVLYAFLRHLSDKAEDISEVLHIMRSMHANGQTFSTEKVPKNGSF